MNEYRKIEITQPGTDPEKPIPNFVSGAAEADAAAKQMGEGQLVGSQDLNMLPEGDGEDF